MPMVASEVEPSSDFPADDAAVAVSVLSYASAAAEPPQQPHSTMRVREIVWC